MSEMAYGGLAEAIAEPVKRAEGSITAMEYRAYNMVTKYLHENPGTQILEACKACDCSLAVYYRGKLKMQQGDKELPVATDAEAFDIPKKRTGRPKGTKNKPRDTASLDVVEPHQGFGPILKAPVPSVGQRRDADFIKDSLNTLSGFNRKDQARLLGALAMILGFVEAPFEEIDNGQAEET